MRVNYPNSAMVVITVTVVSLRSTMLLPALDGRRYKQATASLRARARGVRTFERLGQRPPDRSFC